MDLHPIRPASISMDLHPIRPVELGVHPLRSKAFNRQWIYTQIDQHLLNLTGQIGCKSIEIDAGNSLRLHCVPAWTNWVSSQ